MNFRNPFVQQYLFEVLLPLVGYFFLGWSGLIIAVFYLIDQLGAEFSFIRRYRRTSAVQQRPVTPFIWSAVLIAILRLASESWILYVFFINRNHDDKAILEELGKFAREELWLLVPVVILMYYLKDQFTFFMPRRFLQYDSAKMFRTHQFSGLIILVLTGFGAALFYKWGSGDELILIVFLITKISFDLMLQPRMDRRAKLN